ncbi:MAG: ABC transporter substrate-binding protein [Firmicutes bacterium]|nr:ABC transporter substrate-binding protein [Bacillota bacterium]
MKMKLKQKFGILACAMILAAVPAGCGSANSGGAATPAPKVQTEAAAQTETPSQAPAQTPAAMPTLTWFMPGNPESDIDSVNAAASAISAAKIGANIQMNIIDWGSYHDQIQMKMASSANFDLCFIGFAYPYQEAVDIGGLLEIGSMLPKDAPDLLKEIPDYCIKAVTTDKGVFAIPNVQILAFGGGYYLRGDLAQKYGVNPAAIKTLADIEPYLEQIKTGEPDLVPAERLNADNFRDDKGYHYFSVNGSAVYISDKDNKVYTYYQIPGAEESAKVSFDLYTKGFYRSDIATNIYSGGGDDYYKAGRYALIATTFKPGVESEIKTDTGYDYTYLFNQTPLMGHTSPIETCNAVSRTTKYPDLAVQMINLINTDKDFYNTVCFGIKDKHYTFVDANHISIIPNSGYTPNASWKMGYQFNAFLLQGQGDDTWEKTKQLNDNSVKSPILGIFFNTDDIRTELTQIDKVQKEYLDAYVNTGVKDPAEYWEQYKADMQQAGIDKVLQAYQQQIDAFLGKK